MKHLLELWYGKQTTVVTQRSDLFSTLMCDPANTFKTEITSFLIRKYYNQSQWSFLVCALKQNVWVRATITVIFLFFVIRFSSLQAIQFFVHNARVSEKAAKYLLLFVIKAKFQLVTKLSPCDFFWKCEIIFRLQKSWHSLFLNRKIGKLHFF